jgi:hypothetical protein
MSLFDYEQSRRIAAEGYTFYALIMAAMRQADSGNAGKLARVFPETMAELKARYNAPGGLLETDRGSDGS